MATKNVAKEAADRVNSALTKGGFQDRTAIDNLVFDTSDPSRPALEFQKTLFQAVLRLPREGADRWQVDSLVN